MVPSKAAVLTPTPDVINQCLMALPLIVLCEGSIVVVWMLGRKRLAGFDETGKVEAGGRISNVARVRRFWGYWLPDRKSSIFSSNRP